MTFAYDIALDHKIRKFEYKFKITILTCSNLNLVKIQTYNILCIKSKSPLGRDKKMHKISGQDYNIVTSTLVRNYNIIIHKILCSSQNSIFKIQIHNILCIKSKSPLGREKFLDKIIIL